MHIPSTPRAEHWKAAFLPGASRAVLGTTLGQQANHVDYEAAKSGSVEADRKSVV